MQDGDGLQEFAVICLCAAFSLAGYQSVTSSSKGAIPFRGAFGNMQCKHMETNIPYMQHIYIYIRIKNTILHNVQIYSRIENNVYIYTYATSHWIFRQTSLAISTAHPFLRRWMGLHSGAGASDESETA